MSNGPSTLKSSKSSLDGLDPDGSVQLREPTSVSKKVETSGVQPSDGFFPLKGAVIDNRYEIGECLGESTMGAVYEVKHLRLNKHFAMKTNVPNLSESTEFIDRFNREANALSLLNHPNCVNVIDFGQTDSGMVYLVMDFVEGQNLAEITNGKRIDVSDAIEITRQILMGLGHAHDAGIIHRDIQLNNIIKVKTDNNDIQIKLLDFGLATGEFKDEQSEQITQTGLVMGTPQYLAPEAFNHLIFDEQSDLYAVGVALFRMLVDRPVFGEGSLTDVLTLKRKPHPPDLNDFGPNNYPQALVSFLKKALAPPEVRFSSASQMLEALDEVKKHLTTFNRLHEVVSTEKIKSAASATASSVSHLRHLVLDPIGEWYHYPRATDEKQWSIRLRALFETRPGRRVLGLMFVLFATGALAKPVFNYFTDLYNSIALANDASSTEKNATPLFINAENNTAPSSNGNSEDDVIIVTQKLLNQKKCQQAFEYLSENYPNETLSVNAQYLLGCSQMCTGNHAKALASYRAAFEMDDRYQADTKIVEDVSSLLQNEELRFEALNFLATKIGKSALPTIIQAAESHPSKKLRHSAREHIIRMNALSHMNQAKSFELDLSQSTDCNEMTALVDQIAELGTPDARAVLERIKRKSAKNNNEKASRKYACVRKQIAAHLSNSNSTPKN